MINTEFGLFNLSHIFHNLMALLLPTFLIKKKISETYYLSFSVLKIFASFQPTSASFTWKPEIQPSCTMTIFLKNNSRKCKRKNKYELRIPNVYK